MIMEQESSVCSYKCSPKVLQWLHEVYGEEQIPVYEKNERSINILHQLMKASKRSEDNAKVLAADYTKKAAEYNAEGTVYGRF